MFLHGFAETAKFEQEDEDERENEGGAGVILLLNTRRLISLSLGFGFMDKALFAAKRWKKFYPFTISF